MSSAEVSSKTQTYLPKISSATPLTLPGSALTASRNFGAGRVSEPTAAQRAYVEARDAAHDEDDDAYAAGPGNVGAAVPGAHDLVHSTHPTAAETREGANP